MAARVPSSACGESAGRAVARRRSRLIYLNGKDAFSPMIFSKNKDEESPMPYRTILLHLDRGARTKERLELAFALAASHDAHLTGMFALSSPRIPSYALAEAGPVMAEAEKRQRAEAIQAGEAVFRAAMARNPGVKAEWRATTRDALGAALVSARYADIVVTGQLPPLREDDTAMARDFCQELVLAAGRPVLFVPYAGHFESVGKRVLVAWNASRESARAVTDALPILQRADNVQVVAFEPVQGDEHGEIPGADISLYLARHGVKVTAAQQRSGGVDVGAQVLSRAADLDADLIVLGAYGHSRLREIVLGGVTRTLLESMTVPTLMSH